MPSKLEADFKWQWRIANGPALECEFRFHPKRKWRADFAHVGSRTLIEIEGGIFMRGGGRHSRGVGYAADAEKYLEAVLAGWRVIRLTEKQLNQPTIQRIIEVITSFQTNPAQ